MNIFYFAYEYFLFCVEKVWFDLPCGAHYLSSLIVVLPQVMKIFIVHYWGVKLNRVHSLANLIPNSTKFIKFMGYLYAQTLLCPLIFLF